MSVRVSLYVHACAHVDIFLCLHEGGVSALCVCVCVCFNWDYDRVDETCEIEVTSSSETLKGSLHLQCKSFAPLKVKYLNILHMQVGMCICIENKACLLI